MQPLLARLFVLRQVFESPQLRRLELSWGGYYIGEWTHFVALSVYAYKSGGASALGVFGLVRMLPAAAALPLGPVLVRRYPRQRVLLAIYLARALVLGAAAATLAT